MDEQNFFLNAMVYLLAAVISVPVAKRLRIRIGPGLPPCRYDYWSLRFRLYRE